VWPLPGGAYSFYLRWTQPLTSFTPGTATPTSVTLNIADALLEQILPYGPPALLQHNEPEHAYASESWKKYLEVEARLRGSGRLGQTGLRARAAIT
jgi:hypothetical protein